MSEILSSHNASDLHPNCRGCDLVKKLYLQLLAYNKEHGIQ